MSLVQDPVSGLLLPRQLVDEKQALKKLIDELVDKAVNEYQHLDRTYFLILHAKFDKYNPNEFRVSAPVATFKFPPFITNQFVFWVNNKKGICELLWMTSKRNGKLSVEFNTNGVAYLQAKGAMPREA